MAYAGRHNECFDEDEIEVDEKEVKQLQAVVRGILVRYQLDQVRKEYEEIFKDIERNEKLIVEWPKNTPCLPKISKKRKKQTEQTERKPCDLHKDGVTSDLDVKDNVTKDLDLDENRKNSDISVALNKDDFILPKACDIETQTSFIELPAEETTQRNSTSSQINAFEIDEVQKPSTTSNVTSYPSHVSNISPREPQPEAVQEPFPGSGSEHSTPRLTKESRHDNVVTKPFCNINADQETPDRQTDTVCSKDNYDIDRNVLHSRRLYEKDEIQYHEKLSSERNKMADEDRMKHSLTYSQDADSRPFEKRGTFFDNDSRKLKALYHDSMKKTNDSVMDQTVNPLFAVTPIKHNLQDSSLTSVTMATSVWDSFNSAAEPQQVHPSSRNQQDVQEYPDDPEKLMEIRKNIAMELLWVQQAINSRKNYLQLKLQMKMSPH